MRLFLICLSIAFILFTHNTQAQTDDAWKRFEYSHPSMGSLFRIVCYGQDSLSIRRAVDEAFAKIDTLNSILSDYLSYSELMQLCQTAGSGKYQPVSDDLFKVIALSKKWSKKSDGAFDITIGSITQLWRRASYQDSSPSNKQIQEALKKVNYKYIKLDSSTQSVKLERSGIMLDVGGIAKGYAIDQAFSILNSYGHTKCLIDGAGDIRVGDPPPGKHGWPIAIENLSGIDSTLTLSNKSIATSGDLYRYTEIDGKRYSHIIDPSTGYGITARRTVTVIADNGTKADVIASILSVMGPGEGQNFMYSMSNVEALIVEKEENKIVKHHLGE